MTLTREEFCRLAGITPENFKSMKRRHQLPVDTLFDVDGRERNVYAAADCLMTVFMLELRQQFSLDVSFARELVRGIGQHVVRAKADIGTASEKLKAGQDAEPILAGLVEVQGGKNFHFCAPLAEVITELGRRKAHIVRILAGDISWNAATMRIRAEKAGIDLSEFVGWLQ